MGIMWIIVNIPFHDTPLEDDPTPTIVKKLIYLWKSYVLHVIPQYRIDESFLAGGKVHAQLQLIGTQKFEAWEFEIYITMIPSILTEVGRALCLGLS